MDRSFRQLISFCLLAVYALWFASANFFYHVHYLDDECIVHSHIWNGKAHDHTSDQILLVQLLDECVFESTDLQVFEFSLPMIQKQVVMAESDMALTASSGYILSLRAPPFLS